MINGHSYNLHIAKQWNATSNPSQTVHSQRIASCNTQKINLYISEEMQEFWDPILEITDKPIPRKPFLTRSSEEYTMLVMIGQWYLLRYNQRTQRIISGNIEAALSMMGLERNEIPDPNQMMSLPIRHSDKCYDDTYTNKGAEMLCYEAEHIITIATHIQMLYEAQNNGQRIKYGIVNSEDSEIIQQIINNTQRTFHVLTNINDIRPETGDPKVWDRNEDVIRKAPDRDVNEDGNGGGNILENDYMTSMLTVAQMSTIPKYWLYIFSSHWFFYLSHFRSVMKCWPSNMDIDGDIQIELKSYCKLCPDRMQPGQRYSIYRGVKESVYKNELLTGMFDTECVSWAQKYDEDAGKYVVHCQLTRLDPDS